MKVLIIGAGVSGLTLAAKLLQQGRQPVVVERAAAFEDAGYGIALSPLGSCVLHGIGAYDALIERGNVITSHRIVDGHGALLQDLDLSSFATDIGPMVLLTRTDLIDILCKAAQGADLRMGTTVTAIRQHDSPKPGPVEVTFSDGKWEQFDLVVGSDGMHSHTRSMVFGSEVDTFDSGWSLWVWWWNSPDWPQHQDLECWGAGRFFGFYPTPQHVMACVGLPREDFSVKPVDLDEAKHTLKGQFADFIAAEPRAGAAIDAAPHFFAWPMSDIRSRAWSKGRVALCGDSACGFMPTAGTGANSALRGAAALADELSRAGPDSVWLALELYEKRCRHIIEKNQDDTRQMAKFSFVDNRLLSWGRDEVVKHYPMTKVVSDIIDAMRTPF